MVKISTNSLSAKTQKLKKCIAETFDLSNLAVLNGLSERLKAIGHPSTALALEQLIAAETDPPAEPAAIGEDGVPCNNPR
ncbi:MAG: hypothetical protein HQ483_05145 [Rhodospirillales bacterium]|nr:hypothetical protein [Rhodospirillales bacterium]